MLLNRLLTKGFKVNAAEEGVTLDLPGPLATQPVPRVRAEAVNEVDGLSAQVRRLGNDQCRRPVDYLDDENRTFFV